MAERIFKWIFSWRAFLVVLFLIIFVAPAIQSARLESLREDAISVLHKKRGSRVIRANTP